MHTHFLSDHVVRAYLRDLWDRLEGLGDAVPKTWVSIGTSGDKIIEVLADCAPPGEASQLTIERVAVERGSNTVTNREAPDRAFASDAPDHVLLVDGPVHSGASMQAVADWLFANGVKSIVSYALVVKRTSAFIPTFFGLMIQEHDRALFQLDRISNNRLLTGSSRSPTRFGILRRINEEDALREQQNLNCEVPSVSSVTFADLWYGQKTRGDHVYVYEVAGTIAGFIHFYRKDPQKLVIDAVAVDQTLQGQGIGGSLIRWVENWARCHSLGEIELYSIENRVGMYKKFGYKEIADAPLNLGGGEVYRRMHKRILYNIDPDRQNNG